MYNNNQINARSLISQSSVGYCASKPIEKSRVFRIILGSLRNLDGDTKENVDEN